MTESRNRICVCTSYYRQNRALFFAVAVSLLLLYWMLFPVNHYLAASIYDGAPYRFLIPALFGCYLAARGMRDGQECSILMVYLLWAAFTRILNGDPTLTSSLPRLLDLTLMFLCFAAGIVLPSSQREKVYNGVAWLIVLFYFLLGCLCIYAGTTRGVLMNPLDDYGIGYTNPVQDRIYVLGLHPNSASGKFLISFCLLIYLFTKNDNPLLRVFLVLAGLVDYTTVALTLSRNGQTFMCLCFSLAVSIFAYVRVRRGSRTKKIALFILILLILTPILYQGFEPVRHGIWTAHEKFYSRENVGHELVQNSAYTAEVAVLKADVAYQADDRAYFDSGRKEIYRSAIESLMVEPQRLLIGSSYEHYLDISHANIREQAHNFHNMILEVLNLFGLPGLILAGWFYVLLIREAFVLVFEQRGLFPLPEKMMVLPIIGLSGHFMLEAGAFTDINFRVGFLFFSAGMLTGMERDRTDKRTL